LILESNNQPSQWMNSLSQDARRGICGWSSWERKKRTSSQRMASCNECGRRRAVKKIEQYPKDYQHAGNFTATVAKGEGFEGKWTRSRRPGALSWKRSGRGRALAIGEMEVMKGISRTIPKLTVDALRVDDVAARSRQKIRQTLPCCRTFLTGSGAFDCTSTPTTSRT